jgi:hypothetical protein
MAAEESLGRQFYHGSLHPFQEGDEVVPAQEVAQMPESARRGRSRLTHPNAPKVVYMTTDPKVAGFYGDVHEVEPVGQLKQHYGEADSWTASKAVIKGRHDINN